MPWIGNTFPRNLPLFYFLKTLLCYKDEHSIKFSSRIQIYMNLSIGTRLEKNDISQKSLEFLTVTSSSKFTFKKADYISNLNLASNHHIIILLICIASMLNLMLEIQICVKNTMTIIKIIISYNVKQA